jgi:hypothetical protein
MLVIFCSTLLTTGFCFSETPTYVDVGGDNLPACTDILKVWIDNDATYLRFKFEINASVDQYVYPYYLAFIALDNSTGWNYGWDLPINCYISLAISPIGQIFSAFSAANVSNYLSDPISVGLMYYAFSNNNHTVEFGYKIRTSYLGAGYLNVSTGQTIYLKLMGDTDSDVVPDSAALISYTIKQGSGGIPGFDLLFLNLAIFAVGAYYFLTRKKELI